jgi:outer membrane protein TolC
MNFRKLLVASFLFLTTVYPAATVYSADFPGEALKLDFRHYLSMVFTSNPSYLIEREEIHRAFATFVTSLQGYGFNLNFVPSVNAYYDEGMQYGTDVRMELKKTLYDWGKRGILEKEAELVTSLGKMNLMEKRDAVIMAAAGYYAAFSYAREEYSLLYQRFREYTDFIRRIETAYQKGLKMSSYEYYSAKSYCLRLERDLLNKKAELFKTETAFRQFGHVYSEKRIVLVPLSLRLSADLETLEKEAVARNSAIRAARLGNELQRLSIREKKAERMGSVGFSASVGLQVGTSTFTGEYTMNGTGTQPVVTVGITATVPILDGGVKKNRVLIEEIEALKRKLAVQKETEDVVRRLSEIYTDYLALEKNREITAELLSINGKRLGIAMERFEKGLEEYRSVRESWDDSLVTEMENMRQKAILQKLLVDIEILSGIKSAEVCPAE